VKAPAILFGVAALLGAGSAIAGPPELPRRSLAFRAGYVVMGAKRPTGGPMPTVEGLYAWPLSDAVRLLAGAELGIIVDVEPRWIGVLGGPLAGIAGRPWSAPIDMRLAAHVDLGHLPTCNAWGLCMQYSGLFPAGSFAATWTPSPQAFLGAFVDARYVKTLGWTGAGLGGGLSGGGAF